MYYRLTGVTNIHIISMKALFSFFVHTVISNTRLITVIKLLQMFASTADGVWCCFFNVYTHNIKRSRWISSDYKITVTDFQPSKAYGIKISSPITYLSVILFLTAVMKLCCLFANAIKLLERTCQNNYRDRDVDIHMCKDVCMMNQLIIIINQCYKQVNPHTHWFPCAVRFYA